ncbi:MAG: primosomal protein N' [Coriobacteriia bacterium]|nr:primosomal protein N' [Coriobacteriia bacterium]
MPEELQSSKTAPAPQPLASCFARVILDIPTRALETTFDYAIPPELAKTAQVGCCVLVEFAHRQCVGYLVERMQKPSKGVDASRIKPLEAVLSEPYFDEVSAELAQWIAHEYLAPLSEAIRLFTPPGSTPRLVRDENENWQLLRAGIGAVDDRWVSLTEEGFDYEPPANAAKQRAIIEALRIGEMRVAELSVSISNPATSLKALEKRGVIRIETRRRFRGTAAYGTAAYGAGDTSEKSSDKTQPSVSYSYRSFESLTLTEGQQTALDAILATQEGDFTSFEASAFGAPAKEAPAPEAPSPEAPVILLDGVTGSGKTEVYLRAIKQVLDKGGSAVVLVPEISLTPQTVARFRSRFGTTVAVLHSRLSAGERFDQWDRIRTGDARVVVGARSALFAPLHDLKLIIIDEEHEGTYKQSSSPRYVTRDVAARLASKRGATLVLGSATPSFETLAHCEAQELKKTEDKQGREGESKKCDKIVPSPWRRIELPHRASGKSLPPIQVVNLSAEFHAGNKSMFSSVLKQELQKVIEKKEKAVILLNKRGFASFLLCRDCGYVPMCENCTTSLTYHARPPRLICHHCGATHTPPKTCPECESPYFKELGPGTQFAEEQMKAFLAPDTPIVRMDADTTRGKAGHEKCLDAFIGASHGVLLGTQMIAKGLDFPEVTLVGVLVADTTLKFPDYRAAERTFQLLEQVAGRAGRAEKDGRVIVQTYWPDHLAIRAAASHNRNLLFDEERTVRKELGYPPYGRLADILIWGKSQQQVQQQTVLLAEALQAIIPPEWQLLGPSPCLLSKRQGDYRWHILIKAPLGADIPGVISPVLRSHKMPEGVRLAANVDPYDMI